MMLINYNEAFVLEMLNLKCLFANSFVINLTKSKNELSRNFEMCENCKLD